MHRDAAPGVAAFAGSQWFDFLRRRIGWWFWLALFVVAWAPPRFVDGSSATTGAMAISVGRVNGWHFGSETGTADGPLGDFLAPAIWPENLRGGWTTSLFAAALAASSLLCAVAAAPRRHRWPLGITAILLAGILPAPWLLVAAGGGLIAAALVAPSDRNADADLWLAPALAGAALVHALLLPVAVAVQLAVGWRHWRTGWHRLALRSVSFALAFAALWDACRQPVDGLGAYAVAWARENRASLTSAILSDAESGPARWGREFWLIPRHPTREANAAWKAFATKVRSVRLVSELGDAPVQTPLPDVPLVRAGGLREVSRGAPTFVWRLTAAEPPARALDPARPPRSVPPGFEPAFIEAGVAVWRRNTQPAEWTPPGQIPSTIPAALLSRYGGFARGPVAASAAGRLEPGTVDHEPLVEFTAPGELRFRIRAVDANVRGVFALADAAAAGAEFAVLFADGSGEHEVFRRVLEPATAAGDRGCQRFDFDLPGLGEGFLIFRTVPLPGARGAPPVAGWGRIAFGTMARQQFETKLTAGELHQWGRFTALPARISAFARAAALDLSGRAALGVHAPSEMIFPLRAGATAMTGIYGFNDNAWNNPQAHTAGAVFSIVWRSGARERPLLERHLDPAARPADRGPQSFRVDLRGLDGGQLLLRAAPETGNSNAFGWTAWGEIAIEGQPENLIPSGLAPEQFAPLAGFRSIPTWLAAWAPPDGTRLAGKPALLMHAPSEMVFSLNPGAKELRAVFGFIEGAYQGGNHTDGAVFRVLWQKGAATRELFTRELRPAERPADRGRQSVTVPLAGLADGLLVLRTDVGSAGNGAWDWTCWADVELVPAP